MQIRGKQKKATKNERRMTDQGERKEKITLVFFFFSREITGNHICLSSSYCMKLQRKKFVSFCHSGQAHKTSKHFCYISSFHFLVLRNCRHQRSMVQSGSDHQITAALYSFECPTTPFFSFCKKKMVQKYPVQYHREEVQMENCFHSRSSTI